MKNRIINRNDFIVMNGVNDKDVEAFLLKKNEKSENLLREATKF